jgi:hypothetical protein
MSKLVTGGHAKDRQYRNSNYAVYYEFDNGKNHQCGSFITHRGRLLNSIPVIGILEAIPIAVAKCQQSPQSATRTLWQEYYEQCSPERYYSGFLPTTTYRSELKYAPPLVSSTASGRSSVSSLTKFSFFIFPAISFCEVGRNWLLDIPGADLQVGRERL